MQPTQKARHIEGWPAASREAVQSVIGQYHGAAEDLERAKREGKGRG